MTDIVIYTNQEVLDHKKGINEEFEKYEWTMTRTARKLNEGDRIYFAVNGAVQGSFLCDECYEHINQEYQENIFKEFVIVWEAISWIPLEEKISCKSFRGFRYKWWDN